MSWMERSSSGRFGRGRMRMIGYPTAWLSSSCICLECQYVGLRGRSAKLERAHFTSKRVCTCAAFFFVTQRGMPGVPQRTVNKSKCNGFGAWLQLLPRRRLKYRKWRLPGWGLRCFFPDVGTHCYQCIYDQYCCLAVQVAPSDRGICCQLTCMMIECMCCTFHDRLYCRLKLPEWFYYEQSKFSKVLVNWF